MGSKEKSQSSKKEKQTPVQQPEFTAFVKDDSDLDRVLLFKTVENDIEFYEQVGTGLKWLEDSLEDIQPFVNSEDEDEDGVGDDADSGDTPTPISVSTPQPSKTPEYLTKNLADIVQTTRGFVEAEPNGHIIRIGEPVTVFGVMEDGFVRITQNVYQECLPHRALTKSFVLLYAKNKKIHPKLVTLANPPEENVVPD